MTKDTYEDSGPLGFLYASLATLGGWSNSTERKQKSLDRDTSMKQGLLNVTRISLRLSTLQYDKLISGIRNKHAEIKNYSAALRELNSANRMNSLMIYDNQLSTDESLLLLGTLIKRMNKLQKLDLSVSECQVESEFALHEIIEACAGLKELHMSYMCKSETEMERVLEVVIQEMTELEYLNISGNHLSNKAARLLCDSFPRLNRLKVLDLSDTNFNAENADRLASNLKSLPDIKTVLLTNNKLCERDPSYMMKCLEDHPNRQNIEFTLCENVLRKACDTSN